jgi:hypothetical protein
MVLWFQLGRGNREGEEAVEQPFRKRRGGAAQHRRHIGQEAVARGMKKQETDAYMATLHFQRI